MGVCRYEYWGDDKQRLPPSVPILFRQQGEVVSTHFPNWSPGTGGGQLVSLTRGPGSGLEGTRTLTVAFGARAWHCTSKLASVR